MPTPRINKGAFGGPGLSNAAGEGAKAAILGAEQDLKEGQARNIAREERDYIKSERKRIADERVYQREEDFYVAADIADAGLGYEAGLEDVFRKDKTKFAAIAAKGANATSEERAQLRQFKENINKVSGGQKALKKILGDYRTAIDTDGAISASTPPEIAQLLKDLDMGKGDFKPITGPNGEIRLQGTDSAGNKVDYSYDQLQSLTFSPKYDLNTSITGDIKLIGDQTREVTNVFGGSSTYKNTPGLITAKATDIAKTRLKSPHALYEVGAELGYTAIQRDKIIAEQGKDAFRQLVTEDYTQRLIDSIDSSITTDGYQSQGDVDTALRLRGKGDTGTGANLNPTESIAKNDFTFLVGRTLDFKGSKGSGKPITDINFNAATKTVTLNYDTGKTTTNKVNELDSFGKITKSKSVTDPVIKTETFHVGSSQDLKKLLKRSGYSDAEAAAVSNVQGSGGGVPVAISYTDLLN